LLYGGINLNEDLNEVQQSEEVTAVQETEEPAVDRSGETAIELLRRNPTTIEDVNAIRAAAFASPSAWNRLEHFVREVMTENEPEYEQKYAVGLAILGRYELAEEKLEGLKNIPVAACLLGQIYMDSNREEAAVKLFSEVHERVPEVDIYHVFLIEALEAANDMEGFRRELELLESKAPKAAHTLYFKGIVEEREGEYEAALQLYEEALEVDENHSPSLFRMAFRLDLMGDDNEAMECYKRCMETGVCNTSALINMGVLYEDNERFEEASHCYDLAARFQPMNARLQIYRRDAEASKEMYYDEEREKKEDKQAQILRIPVTDFELSVRSRNCLSKMNIRSLGDLISKTEAELLAFKNFGETSLQEIKGILSSKGLRLGMITTDTEELPKFLEPVEMEEEKDSVLGKPLEELDLSVRSRNCLVYLQIKTLGHLADTTEQQLLSCKNFGQTSLNEIRKKLADYGLSLKV
jgi:DNA-directed RNA polymerase subunit alpha